MRSRMAPLPNKTETEMPTPLDNYPRVRLAVYNLFWAIGLATCSVQIYCVAMGHAAPTWLNGVMAVYTYLGTAVGYIAQANTPK
jgi:hypothetical protein